MEYIKIPSHLKHKLVIMLFLITQLNVKNKKGERRS